MATISSNTNLGVGSQLPLEQLLADLRTNEEKSLGLINDRAKTVQNRLSGYGTIKNSLEAFQKAWETLGEAETFGALKTSVNGTTFTAVATSAATANSYNIEVQQLATPQTLTSAGQASRSEALAGGSVDIEVTLLGGKSKTITVDQADTSLEGIAKAINSDSGLGVSATLINDGAEPPQSYLLLTAKDTGENASIESITVTNSDTGVTDDALQNIMGFTKGANGAPNTGALQEQAAQNSKLLINNISITSQSNTVENAIDGVTLTLTEKSEPGSTDVLGITRDDSVTSKAISSFVSAYNNLQGIVKTLTTFDVNNPAGAGALSGDSLARSIQSQIRNALNAPGATGMMKTLTQLGISTDPKEGTLTIDSADLGAALKDNMVDVQALFTGDNGIVKQLTAVTDTFVKSGGVISAGMDSMTATLKDMEDQFDAESLRIDSRMENYRKQFTALDTLVAQMGSVSSYLTQQLSALGNMNDN